MTGWETEQERLIRSMRMKPKQKLTWLREINEFLQKYTPAKTKKIKQALKAANSLGSC